jgi:hypothetical protein
MGATAKPRCAALLLTIVALGVSLGLPAEDVLEVVYDESEPMPYEAIVGFSVVLPQTSAPIAKASTESPVPRIGSSAKCRKLRPKNSPRMHGVSHSLVIANHSLRC